MRLHDTILIRYRIHVHIDFIADSSSSSYRRKGNTLQKHIGFIWIPISCKRGPKHIICEFTVWPILMNDRCYPSNSQERSYWYSLCWENDKENCKRNTDGARDKGMNHVQGLRTGHMGWVSLSRGHWITGWMGIWDVPVLVHPIKNRSYSLVIENSTKLILWDNSISFSQNTN